MQMPQQILKQVFGYSNFRPGQEKVISLVLNKQNTLAVMPTGGGKSICYQIPALIQPGVTLVVSPLISLMKDQIDSLRQNGIAAAALNSSTPQEEVNPILRQAYQGKIKLLYVTPERLAMDYFRYQLNFLDIDLVAVDEAHCISQWGHDFRPAYRQLLDGIKVLKSKPSILALTATATPRVQKDIAEQLDIPTQNFVITSFARSNLKFSVLNSIKNTNAYMLQIIRAHPNQAGIIYSNTRKKVEEINEYLKRYDIKLAAYHAGLSNSLREEIQDDFQFNRLQVIVATNAFGMGIDKSNVRFVIHANSASNIESYYQEAGRAGRDGEESEVILIYHPGDVRQYRWFIDESDASDEYKKLQYEKLQKVTNYANTDQCLQQFIVRYFGQDCDACQKCSNCLNENKKVDVTDYVKKIISMIYELDGRFGKSVVAQAVSGSTNQRMKEIGANKLEHFGSLKISQKEIMSIIDFLIANNFLESIGDQYPVIHVTNRGWDVLDGKVKVLKKEAKKPRQVAISDNLDLFDDLRQMRLELARKQKVPAFMILSDKTLHEVAAKKPDSREKLLEISGIGREKMRRYGKKILQTVTGFQK